MSERVRFIPGPTCDLTTLADDEYVIANVAENGWDVYRDRPPVSAVSTSDHTEDEG